ncbi:MAG: hypothetical protein KIS95_06415 [Anaerolineae bacterium]|uniref:hypothetical protein n=1 Tax=Promineifilum sp. TaxID=2664178 RepID=UPI001DA3BF55|nr:hypothetical protein [Anaerolineales bacterium]MCB8934236.1 hypothetical protein [Promineifilum sp.]MCO5179715.1 hypothetical protein [Promineifilum sp.]MCW5846842.1 hypothetical protein [Anaerolineae bacterium]
MKHSNYLPYGVLALGVDAATFFVAWLVLPELVSRLQQPDGWNALLVSGVFVFFVAGVFLLRRLKATPQGRPEWLSRGARAALALFFAFVLSLMLAWQLGFFASAFEADTTQMGEGGAASYFVFGPGAWLAFSLIYVLVFAFRVEPALDEGKTGYWIAALLGLATAGGMTLVMAAQAHVIGLALGGGWWWSVFAFVVLALLFLPVRLLYLSRTTGLRSPVAGAAVVGLGVVLLVLVARQMS